MDIHYANLARKYIRYYFINEGSFNMSEKTCFSLVLVPEFEFRTFNNRSVSINTFFLMLLLQILRKEISFENKNQKLKEPRL